MALGTDTRITDVPDLVGLLGNLGRDEGTATNLSDRR
jgi:hypothetical protein